MADMTKFAGASFIKVDDVRAGPLRETIAAVGMGKYDKPELTFVSGNMLSVNATNVRVLIRNYGKHDSDWVGQTIELYLGETVYNATKQESVLVRPISPGKPAPPAADPDKGKGGGNGAAAQRDDMNDAIPF